MLNNFFVLSFSWLFYSLFIFVFFLFFSVCFFFFLCVSWIGCNLFKRSISFIRFRHISTNKSIHKYIHSTFFFGPFILIFFSFFILFISCFFVSYFLSTFFIFVHRLFLLLLFYFVRTCIQGFSIFLVFFSSSYSVGLNIRTK